MNMNRWVDERLAVLDDGREWQPEPRLALTRLRELDRRARVRRRWGWAGAVAACLALMAFIVVYCVVFGTGIYYIFRLLLQGPSPSRVLPLSIRDLDAGHSGRRPMSAVE